MSKEEEVFYGAVRRRESLRTAHQRQQAPLPNFMTLETHSSIKDPSAALAEDLASLEMKKKAALTTPPPGEVKLEKLPSLVLLIALAFMAALFFIVGFLTCYTLFPPYGGFSLTHAALQTIAPTTTDPAHPAVMANGSMGSYTLRQQQLAKASGRKVSEPNLLAKAEKQSLAQAKFQAQSSIFQAINNATNKLRATLGDRLGSIAAPLTTGIAQSVANQKTNQIFEKAESKITSEPDAIPSSSQTSSLESPHSQDRAALHKEAPKNADSKPGVAPTAIPTDLFTIHVRDVPDQAAAQEYVSELKKRGFTNSYYTPLWAPQGMIYSVKAGHYKTYQEALSAKKILSEQGGQLTRIVPLSPDEVSPH